MISRNALRAQIESGLARSPAVALLGPRQCGKTTLARSIWNNASGDYLDLEDPTDLARLEDPKLALSPLRGLVVIDEVQRKPELFPLLRVLLDREPSPATFLLLGSASPEVVRGTSESLAGRVELIEMGGFALSEVGASEAETLWLQGGFPRSFLAADNAGSLKWREDFITTFVERDLRMLNFNLPPLTMRRFLTMIAHYHGQVWNASEIARSLQLSQSTIQRYLEIFHGAYLLRILPPWFVNVGKRVVKSPRVYFRDSGLLHALLGVGTLRELQGHPKLGASWEGFALEQVLRVTGSRHASFWSTHGGAEMDLLLTGGSRPIGIEFKYTSVPRRSRSMTESQRDLGLERIYVIYPGEKRFPIGENMEALSLPALLEEMKTNSITATASCIGGGTVGPITDVQ